MISAQHSALSALQAFSTRVHSNANNIANTNTESFKRTRVTLASTEPQGVKANVEKVNTPGAVVFEEGPEGTEQKELSNVEISTEFPEMNLNSALYKANLKTLQVADDMTGTLLELKA
ncbi:flagellar basal body rod C-terminal domain-containing protein [Desulfopila sp. IMCC35008]|uniref:flagellar basal body rod C-terminal domain-containing protein n=1 Tax=Desulfopila sp. IMCC35008 TaxID=2653858 RepID=UPI0013D74F27|nr:flagellar basal body rod C-terminal domain-containing protein [Desulfopila sp. IMCC35008]